MSWGIVAVAGATVVGGLIGANASKKAANAQAGAANNATEMQGRMYDITREDLAPYRDAGAPALERLMYLTGLGGKGPAGQSGSLLKPFSFTQKDFAADPGYEFRKSEGEKAITRGARARGLDASSGTLKNLMRFNQDLASNEFGVAHDRAFRTDAANKQQPFNVLSYLAGTGQNAAAMTGQAGVNTAAGVSQSLIAGGNASAAGTLGAASSWNNALQGGLGNYMYQQRWDQMMNRFPVFSSGGTSGGMTPTQLNAMAPS